MSESASPGSSSALRLRPLPLSELLDEAFRMYRSHFLNFFLVALLVGLPGLLFNFATGSFKTTGNLLTSLAVRGTRPGVAPQLLASPSFNPAPVVAVAIIFLVAAPFLVGGLTATAVGVAQGRPVTLSDVVKRVLARYLPVWGVLLLEGLAAIGLAAIAIVAVFLPIVGIFAALLVILPLAIFIFVRWAVVLPAMFAEGCGAASALRRSWTLVQGNWWRVFAILFFSGLLVTILAAALGFALGLLAYLIPGLSGDDRGAVSVVAQTVAAATVSPVSAVITSLIYFDLRVRKESVDLDQLALQAAFPPTAASSLPPPTSSPRYRGLYTPPARPDSPPPPLAAPASSPPPEPPA